MLRVGSSPLRSVHRLSSAAARTAAARAAHRLSSAPLLSPRTPSPRHLLSSSLSPSSSLARRSAHPLLHRSSPALLALHPGGSPRHASSGGAPPPAKWTPAWLYTTGKEMLLHYYHGTKLLMADTAIAARLLKRLALGHRLSRREHNLLVRVLADLSRVIPLAFFVLVPFMEFALPFALRIFPNLLPSTFEEKHHKEEKRKKLLQVRLEIAQVLEHTLEKRASEMRKGSVAEEEGAEMKDDTDAVRAFMLRMRQGGRAASPDELLSVMRKFKDKITLDGLQRDQLVSMCSFLGLPHFAPTAVLRFQLRQHLRRLRNEDKEILWESVSSLKHSELEADLRARGIPTLGLTEPQMRKALDDWLVLSKTKEISYSLLILTNMLRFAQLRDAQATSREQADTQDAIDMNAAHAALSSITAETVESTLAQDKPTPKEALDALRREEALVEEERQAKEVALDEERQSAELALAEERRAEEVLDDSKEKQAAAEADEERTSREQVQEIAEAIQTLSREQIEDIAEAIQTMSSPTACAAEREEMRELEEERQLHREEIDEATKASREIAMLNSRVNRMLEDLRQEMDQADGDIGQVFRSLDLDEDGVMSHDELLAVDEVKPAPDAPASRRVIISIPLPESSDLPTPDNTPLLWYPSESPAPRRWSNWTRRKSQTKPPSSDGSSESTPTPTARSQ
mmetsp:Transcript_13457/g.32082  ORF Transcript_13457/g.32082 Transcript_13457/m.32082 type:complete len:686 (-) Transcript_13457:483-2540(-)